MHSFLCCFEFMTRGYWFSIYGDDIKFPFKLNLSVFFLSESMEIEWVNNITGSNSIRPKQIWSDWDFRNTRLIKMSPATMLIHPYLACSQQRWRPRGHSPVCLEDMSIPPPVCLGDTWSWNYGMSRHLAPEPREKVPETILGTQYLPRTHFLSCLLEGETCFPI